MAYAHEALLIVYLGLLSASHPGLPQCFSLSSQFLDPSIHGAKQILNIANLLLDMGEI